MTSPPWGDAAPLDWLTEQEAGLAQQLHDLRADVERGIEPRGSDLVDLAEERESLALIGASIRRGTLIGILEALCMEPKELPPGSTLPDGRVLTGPAHRECDCADCREAYRAWRRRELQFPDPGEDIPW